MRIAYGRFSQESNTFSPVVTDMDVFRRQGYAVGDDIDPRSGGKARNSLWAFADVCDDRGGVELVPLVRAGAGASGRVTKDAFDRIMAAFAEQLDAMGEVDAVYLGLHGAMAAEHDDDPEGLLLEMVREKVGPDVWLVASTDHHACITRRKIANADIIVGHRTQPHDPYHTGQQTAEALFRVVDGNMRPVVAMRKAPMITHQEQYLTRKPPMKIWFDLAREMESRPGVISVSTYPMQPWLDVEEGGWASIVYTDNDPHLADDLAKELTRKVWSLREDLMVQESVPVEEAVARAEAAPRGIVVLSDTGDSVAGGASGESNAILAEMIRQQVKGTALVPMVDEAAALAAAEAGVGATIEVRLGRSSDTTWGEPITVTAEVLNITDGKLAADIDDEAQEFGTTALLKVGNVLVGVSRYRTGSVLKPLFWKHLGIDATDRDAVRTVVVKTASNFQYFADWTEELIRVDTAGHTQSRVLEFDWVRLPRPAFPLDADAALDF
ncbi:MAG TPA: M81 family metallopeptidase, partial [Acidimicrobiia bacterium]|nr:M81 family metallopeptidase [Acidimicrobiia bacterium]